MTRRSLLLATTGSTLPWWRIGTKNSNGSAWAAIETTTPTTTLPTPVSVPRGASAADALHEALVGRGLDRVALVLEPGATYDGSSLVVDRESRAYGAPAPWVSVLVGGGGEGGGGTGVNSTNSSRATLRLETKRPYARVLEVRGEGAFLRAENVRILHGSKSVASNYAVLASAGATLELEGCEVTSSTGAGVSADGSAGCALVRCALVGSARQGLAAFGGSRDNDTAADGPAVVVRLRDCRVERNGADGLLVRDGAAVLLEGECLIAGNQGAGMRWFVLEEREAEAALAIAAGRGGDDGLILIAPGARFSGNNKAGAVVVDTGGGAGDDRAAAALAAALMRRREGGEAIVTVL